ncbi:MAG: class I tRNA ligase family protein, partial [Proteobacteria bacterium]|nr:class I tRNA ligase family protein [Pseudomonadota bacterium]
MIQHTQKHSNTSYQQEISDKYENVVQDIEQKWQAFWQQNKTYEVTTDAIKEKYYILNMFPYPSGAGLHVGHPLGYISADIMARYKTLLGFNVLHPMGFDAFGLPAEQYAIQTGQHPADITKKNIDRYREQLQRIGLSYDWSREISTCDPAYYSWTQWVFLALFDHWFDTEQQKARPMSELKELLAQQGTKVPAASHDPVSMTADQWQQLNWHDSEQMLHRYRLAYLDDATVNWCDHLGTVLANDEIQDGLSVRGGHPVRQKKIKHWKLRVSAYAPRLLTGLNHLDWSDSLKTIQQNWIG